MASALGSVCRAAAPRHLHNLLAWSPPSLPPRRPPSHHACAPPLPTRAQVGISDSGREYKVYIKACPTPPSISSYPHSSISHRAILMNPTHSKRRWTSATRGASTRCTSRCPGTLSRQVGGGQGLGARIGTVPCTVPVTHGGWTYSSSEQRITPGLVLAPRLGNRLDNKVSGDTGQPGALWGPHGRAVKGVGQAHP